MAGFLGVATVSSVIVTLSVPLGLSMALYAAGEVGQEISGAIFRMQVPSLEKSAFMIFGVAIGFDFDCMFT